MRHIVDPNEFYVTKVSKIYINVVNDFSNVFCLFVLDESNGTN